MTLPLSPPRYSSWAELVAPTSKTSGNPWAVYAVQCVLTPRGVAFQLRAPKNWVFRSGVWDDRTDRAVRKWQHKRGLAADGVFGARSMAVALEEAGAKGDRAYGLPEGVCRGVAVGEGANVLAATNDDNPPCIDCGPEQRRRCPPWKLRELRQSFSPWWALRNAARTLRGRQKEYMARSPRLKADPQEALRVAVLAHNAPFLAEQIVRNGRLSTPDAIATWTHNPGGGSYTHAEWSVHYPATILRFVV